jgi:hypothetical protein
MASLDDDGEIDSSSSEESDEDPESSTDGYDDLLPSEPCHKHWGHDGLGDDEMIQVGR